MVTNKQRLLNRYEEVTYDALRAVCRKDGAHVFPKVRIADVFSVKNSGISARHFSFALKAHFDFLVTNAEYDPLFSVEYDGPIHRLDAEQCLRDRLKNEICDHFEHSLLRVNSRYLDREYRNLNLLTYFVEAWFLEKAFADAQQKGIVPRDEGFDMTFICSDGTREGEHWPYWLSCDIQDSIYRLYEEKRVAHLAASNYVGVDDMGNHHCLSWLVIDHERAIRVKTGMRAQRFPAVMESDLLPMIAMFELYDQLLMTLNGSNSFAIRNVDFFGKELPAFEKRYDMRGRTVCSGMPELPASTMQP